MNLNVLPFLLCTSSMLLLLNTDTSGLCSRTFLTNKYYSPFLSPAMLLQFLTSVPCLISSLFLYLDVYVSSESFLLPVWKWCELFTFSCNECMHLHFITELSSISQFSWKEIVEKDVPHMEISRVFKFVIRNDTVVNCK